MGIIKQGILGGFSGKVGGVVGSSWKGIAVMKAKPLSVANPKTAAQTTQRNAFAFMVAFAKKILASTIKPLNDKFVQGKSGFNAFISRNIATMDGGTWDTPEGLKIAQGALVGFESPSVVFDESSSNATLSWTDNSGEGTSDPLDKVYAIVYKADGTLVGVIGTGVTREDEQAIIAGLSITQGVTYYIAFAFLAADGSKVSTGQALSAVAQA